MTWVTDNPYKMAVIMSAVVSVGAAFIHYKQTYPFFNLDQFLLWLPAVWCMVLVAPVSNSILNEVKRWDGSAEQ